MTFKYELEINQGHAISYKFAIISIALINRVLFSRYLTLNNIVTLKSLGVTHHVNLCRMNDLLLVAYSEYKSYMHSMHV